MKDCLFCRIVAGEIAGSVVYRDDDVTAFRDIQPQAPTHILLVPNEHIGSLDAATPEQTPLLGRLMQLAAELARQEGIAAGGYRLALNTGPDAGQSVGHLHLHLLGGRRFNWPPG